MRLYCTVIVLISILISTSNCKQNSKSKEKQSIEVYDSASIVSIKLKDTNLSLVTLRRFADIETDRLRVGMGYNTANGELMDYVVVDTPLVPALPVGANNSNGQKVNLEAEIITSYNDLKQKFSLDVATSMSYGVFKGSTQSSFMKSKSFNKYSAYLLITVKVVNPH